MHSCFGWHSQLLPSSFACWTRLKRNMTDCILCSHTHTHIRFSLLNDKGGITHMFVKRRFIMYPLIESACYRAEAGSTQVENFIPTVHHMDPVAVAIRMYSSAAVRPSVGYFIVLKAAKTVDPASLTFENFIIHSLNGNLLFVLSLVVLGFGVGKHNWIPTVTLSLVEVEHWVPCARYWEPWRRSVLEHLA